jgi:hypothetical protein
VSRFTQSLDHSLRCKLCFFFQPKQNRTQDSPTYLQQHHLTVIPPFEPMATMLEDRENMSTPTSPKAKQQLQQQQQQQQLQQQTSKKFWFMKPGKNSGNNTNL